MTGGDATRKYLWDARRAADRIARFTAGRDFAAYLADEMLRAGPTQGAEILATTRQLGTTLVAFGQN